jgi:DNA-binding CsgD family transcriptional regulator
MFDKRKFQAQLILAGKTMEDVANILGINVATLYRKINNNGSFTRREISAMLPVLGVEDPCDIFFAEELTETQE